METKKKNEMIALAVVIFVTITGFLLIYFFYLIISPVELKGETNKSSLEIKGDVLEKITSQNSNSSLQLDDNNLGRENPFGKIN